MKQEALRKLRHRILAGILCFSIIFAAAPNSLNASAPLEEGNAGEAAYGEGYEGTDGVQMTEESTEMNVEDFLVEGTGEEQQEDLFKRCEDVSTASMVEDGNSDDLPEEALYEEADKNTSGNNSIKDTDEDGISDSEKAGIEFPSEVSTVPEPQTAEVHQHSMSVDCSVSAGEQVIFTELTGNGGIMPEGNYYLNEDITILNTLQFSGTTNLCLNGHTLRYVGTTPDSVITVLPDSTLNICDCVGTGSITGGSLSGIYIRTGTLNFYGGTITDNAVPASNTSVPSTVLDGWMRHQSGGGVFIVQGTFNMYGGRISNNKNTEGGGNTTGGGVSVGVSGSDFLMGGTFHMYGGTISGNAVGSRGGGIHCNPNTNTVIYNGTISDNTAHAGGGIYVSGAALLIKGGEISGHTTYYGGGIFISNIKSKVELSGGTISNNTAESNNGGGVYIDAGDFLMSGGEITNNSARGMGGGIYSEHETTYDVYGICELSGGTISNNTARQGSGAYLLKGAKLSGAPVVHNNINRTGNADNLYIPSANSAVTINGSISKGASIGVTYESSSGIVVMNSPFAIPEAGLDIRQNAQYFFCDNGGYGTLYKDTPTEGIYFGDGINVTYNYTRNGGNSATLDSAFVEKNTTLDLSPDASNAITAVKDGWEFLGWNTDPDATDVLDTLSVKEENITLYAIYKKTLTASFYSGNEGQKKIQTITLYNRETEGKVTAPTLEALPGWTALGWDRNRDHYEGRIKVLSDISLTEDCDFYGIYQQPITISYDANGGETTPAGETKDRYANVHNMITYQNPVVALAPAVSRAGYTFDGWHQGSSTGTVRRPGEEVEVTGNTTFYAGWTADTERTYVVEHYWQDVTGDGYTLMDTIPCKGTAGTKVEAEARIYNGLTENTDHSSRIPSGLIAEDGSLVLRLYYDRNTYTVSFDLNDGEGTVPEDQVIRYGGKVAPVPAPTREGYAFTGWYTEKETESGIQWNFTATVEENERNRNRSFEPYDSGIHRSIKNTDIILYAGWQRNTVSDTDSTEQPGIPGSSDTDNSNNSNTTDNNKSDTASTDHTANTSNPVSGNRVPGTGDHAHLELYATAAMIAGLSYLLLELADEPGMTEQKKRELTARLIQWAKQGGAGRRLLAVLAMFLLLVYYHSIGKKISAQSIQVLEK